MKKTDDCQLKDLRKKKADCLKSAKEVFITGRKLRELT